jgi:hypothetical protein|tara:strand:+ start:344 stop:550 length:207 start_codon:yes stop_codon:yes gene_type:complete
MFALARFDLSSGQKRPNFRDRLVAKLTSQVTQKVLDIKKPLRLTGQLLIDHPNFGGLQEAGQFGSCSF